jgi:hypothetical protein
MHNDRAQYASMDFENKQYTKAKTLFGFLTSNSHCDHHHHHHHINIIITTTTIAVIIIIIIIIQPVINI